MSAENNSNIVDKNTILKGDDFLKYGFIKFDFVEYRRVYGSFLIGIMDWFEGSDLPGNNYDILVEKSGDIHIVFDCKLHAITIGIIENLFSLLTLIEENGILKEGGSE